MPLAQRIVLPERLHSIRTVDTENVDDLDLKFLQKTLLQLSSLAYHADDIFCSLSAETSTICNRIGNLDKNVRKLRDHVDHLDSKTVQVPEGSLRPNDSEVPVNYKSGCFLESSLFSNDSRPDSICALYDDCDPTPLPVFQQCDIYRTDGMSCSSIFSIKPFVQGVILNVPPSTKTQKRVMPKPKRAIKQPKTTRPKSLSAASDIDVSFPMNQASLPTPENHLKELSRSQPITLVPIDVTGVSFSRQSDIRASQRISQKENIYPNQRPTKRKRRRQTVSGVPGFVFQEVNENVFPKTDLASLRTKSASRERWERPRSLALETYAPKQDKRKQPMHSPDNRKGRSLEMLDSNDSKFSYSCSLRRSLKSLFKGKRPHSPDLWMETRPEVRRHEADDELRPPLRRSRSLPRSLRNIIRDSVSRFSHSRSASTEGHLDSDFSSLPRTSSRKHSSQSRDSKSKSSLSSLPHSRTFTEGCNIGISRQTLDEIRTSQSSSRLHENVSNRNDVDSTRNGNRGSFQTPVMENTFIATGEQHVHVNIPSKPWTKPFAKVKMRGSVEKVVKDRQTSSGNWSGSNNSARQSSEQEYKTGSQERKSHQSDKDSAVSLGNFTSFDERLAKVDEVPQDDDVGLQQQNRVSDISEISRQSSEFNHSYKYATVKSFISISSNESGAVNQNPTLLTFSNLTEHDNINKPVSTYRPKKYLGDDESSIYSVDDQGFFTSMHKDCGVKKSTDDLYGSQTSSYQNQYSSSSTVNSYPERGKSRLENILDKFSSLKRGNKKHSKKTPPPPPPRQSAALSKSNLELEEFPAPDTPPLTTPTEIRKLANLAQKIAEKKQREADSLHSESLQSEDQTSSFSDMAAVILKTQINSSAFTTLCPVTPDCSDSEDELPAMSVPAQQTKIKMSASAPCSLNKMKSFGDKAFIRADPIEESADEPNPDTIKTSILSFEGSEPTNKDTGDKLERFSTWPRSHNSGHQSKEEQVQPPTDIQVMSRIPSKPACPTAILDMARQAPTALPVVDEQEDSDRPTSSNSRRVPGDFQGQPFPASAQLIISSPVAGRALFVDNPHKRSVCSPVTEEDINKYKSYNTSDKWYNTLPRNHSPKSVSAQPDETQQTSFNDDTELHASVSKESVYLATSDSIRSVSGVKHSSSFPAPTKGAPSSYGRTWYDGVGTNERGKKDVTERTPEERPSLRLTSFLTDSSNKNISPLSESRRNSGVSTISSTSSNYGKRISGIGGPESQLNFPSARSSSSVESVAIRTRITPSSSATVHSDIHGNHTPSSFSTKESKMGKHERIAQLDGVHGSANSRDENTTASQPQQKAIEHNTHSARICNRDHTIDADYSVSVEKKHTIGSASPISTLGRTVVSIENSKPVRDAKPHAQAKYVIHPRKTQVRTTKPASFVKLPTEDAPDLVKSTHAQSRASVTGRPEVQKPRKLSIPQSHDVQGGSAFAIEPIKPSPRRFEPPRHTKAASNANKEQSTHQGIESTKKALAQDGRPSGKLKLSIAKSTTDLPSALGGAQQISSKENPQSLTENRRNRWSVTDLSGSMGNINKVSNTLSKSMASLAKSSDSLASNLSLSDRNRVLKFSFLSTDSGSISDIDKRFEEHKFKLSSSRTSLNSLKFLQNGSEASEASGRGKMAQHKQNESKVVSPVQGKFVSSLINQFQSPKSTSRDRESSVSSTRSSASSIVKESH